MLSIFYVLVFGRKITSCGFRLGRGWEVQVGKCWDIEVVGGGSGGGGGVAGVQVGGVVNWGHDSGGQVRWFRCVWVARGGVLLITLRTLTLKNFRITHLMNAENLAKYYTTPNKIKVGESIFM